MLIVMSGLPGTGKSAISKGLSQALGAIHIRIDTIEQTLLDLELVEPDMGPTGYVVGYRIALDNLRLGLTVVADSVNPIAITRDTWCQVGEQAGMQVIEVEVICSDAAEHRRRVETREPEVKGLLLPTWDEVISREYDHWEREHLIIDTAGQSETKSVQQAIELVRGQFT